MGWTISAAQIAKHGQEDSALNRSLLRRLFGEQHGQAIIEMAVAMPLFILMIMGTFELSMMMMSYCSANYAARMAARYASIHSSSSLSPATVASVTAVVNDNLWVRTTSTPAVVVCWGGGCSNPANNFVGNLVGVGVVWWNAPFLSGNSGLLTTQAYRIVTR
jgi:Flp pilus assembly protein TadG